MASTQACARQADTPHTRGDGTTPAASLQRGEARTGLPFSYRLDPPNTPKGHRQQPEAATAATPGRGHWGDRSNTTTRLQAPEAQPGPLQGHRTGSRGVKAPQPQPTTGRQRGMPATSQDPSTPPRAKARGQQRSGRFPHPCYPHTTHGWGRQNEGPAGQNERLGSVRHERPSLIWSSLGPAQESTTAPHRSQSARSFNTWSEGGGHDPARTATSGARCSLAGPRLPLQAVDNPSGERLTRTRVA